MFVGLLAARLRAASATISELREQRDRDVETIARMRQEALQMSITADETVRTQAALEDAQAALSVLRSERDLARRQADLMRRQHHAFMAGLAHDLRNPLAPLSNGIELLRLTDNDAAGRLRTRGIMERQIGNLMRMADDLSDLARLSGEQAGLQDTMFDFSTLLHDVRERTLAVLRTQEMDLEVNVPAGEPLTLRGDAQRLGQAFVNLVNDLARHAERGTSIHADVEAEAGMLRVLLRTALDVHEGEPASPDGLAERPLEDVHASRLGLGVALSDQLVALHGGALHAQRPAGTRRARFTVMLPLATAEPAVVARALPTSGADGESVLDVLLADDNVDFSQSFGTMLELLGHRVTLVHDGLAAVSSIIGSPPDIAFVDIGMPSLDGVEAVRRVRGQGNTQGVVLVAVTGRGGAEDRARAAEAGFDRYLVKPFAMQDVRAALDAARALRSGSPARAPGSFASAQPA